MENKLVDQVSKEVGKTLVEMEANMKATNDKLMNEKVAAAVVEAMKAHDKKVRNN